MSSPPAGAKSQRARPATKIQLTLIDADDDDELLLASASGLALAKPQLLPPAQLPIAGQLIRILDDDDEKATLLTFVCKRALVSR